MVTFTAVTTPSVKTAVAKAPTPAPIIVTVGGVAYPEPVFVAESVIPVTTPLATTAVAVGALLFKKVPVPEIV